MPESLVAEGEARMAEYIMDLPNRIRQEVVAAKLAADQQAAMDAEMKLDDARNNDGY